MRATVFFDGGNRGSPGPHGCAAVLTLEDGRTIEHVRYLGDDGTNNRAEYGGLILALKLAAEHGVTELKIRGDSKLIVEQVLGVWKIREPSLRPYAQLARELASAFERVEIKHVPREENTLADALVTELLDRRVGRARGGKKQSAVCA